MGLEKKNCSAIFKDGSSKGTLYLDSNHLTFRNKEVRWETKIGKGTSAKVESGNLTVRRGSKTATFMIGSAAEKWATKIVNPPSRATKLGLKPDQRFLLKGEFSKQFEKELSDHGLTCGRGPKSCEIAFVILDSANELKLFQKLARDCTVGVHIWALWPKGIKNFGQSDVMGVARELGMGPGKKIAFDEKYSAMRFTKK